MDKVLPILEKYAQWIALGFGAVFLILMAVLWLPDSALKVKVENQQVDPGAVGDLVKNSPAVQTLAQAVKARNAPPEGVPSETLIAPKPAEAGKDMLAILTAPVQVAAIPRGDWPPKPPTTKGTSPVDPDARLAVLPPLTGLKTELLRGMYRWAKPAAVAAALAGAAGGGPAAGVADAALQVEQKDLDVVVVRATGSLKEIDDAFRAAKLDPTIPYAYPTQIVGVELVRQERNAITGKWGAPTVVGVLPPYTLIIPPVPPATATADAKRAFLRQTPPIVDYIVQPPFLEVVSGDAPGMTTTDANGNPTTMPAGVAPGLPAGVAPGLPVGGIGSGLPVGGLRPGVPGFPQPGIPQPGFPQPGFPQPGFPQPGVGAAGVPAGVELPLDANNQPVQPLALGEIPGKRDAEGKFNPADLVAAHKASGLAAPDFTVIAYDTTVEAGRSYQYKLRYFLRNPLFDVIQPGLKKDLVETATLASPESDWTAEVTPLPRVEFYTRSVSRNEATFDVMVVEGGAGMVGKAYKFAPGDVIAGDGWNSGWAVADIRRNAARSVVDPRDAGKGREEFVVLVVDAKGKTERRSPEKDMADKALKHPTAYDPGAGFAPQPGQLQPGIAPPLLPPPVAPPVGGPRRPVRPPVGPAGGV